MESHEAAHLTFVKNNEITSYQKAWPNHVIVGLPPSCNYEGLGAIKDIIKVTYDWSSCYKAVTYNLSGRCVHKLTCCSFVNKLKQIGHNLSAGGVHNMFGASLSTN